MKTISKKQTGMIKTLLNQLGADSADMAFDYSNGRTEHISQLYSDEASQLIKWLLNSKGQPLTPKEKMQRKILSIAHQLHWELPFARKGENGRSKSNPVDMEKVDNFCIRRGHLKKPFDQYTEEELPKLVYQFEQALRDFLKGM